MSDELEAKIKNAIRDPKNMGEMTDADSVGTAGSPGCGDMLRMWVKYRDEGGKKVIDKASFQTFGCETALAVASVATELIQGKTADEAMAMKGEDLSAPLGPLPPMKIHCASLVEEALRYALEGEDAAKDAKPEVDSGLLGSMAEAGGGGKIVFKKS